MLNVIVKYLFKVVLAYEFGYLVVYLSFVGAQHFLTFDVVHFGHLLYVNIMQQNLFVDPATLIFGFFVRFVKIVFDQNYKNIYNQNTSSYIHLQILDFKIDIFGNLKPKYA